jgi:phosphoenolpyruvate synthase/pyruvate phosphate dikinase
MPRNKGDKDKKKRKSRGILVKSGLLGVPTGLGLLGGKGASNYWSNTKGVELYGAYTLTPKLLREFYANKELTKPYRENLVKRIKSLKKTTITKVRS